MKNLILLIALALLIPTVAAAQGSAFSFQGRLNDGTTPANGSYDLQFSLYSAIVGGAQIGATVAKPNTTLVNGVFSVMLDFGATAFNDPTAVFIEIGIKPNGSPNAFTILGPRQQLTVVPFAVRATSAASATFAQTASFASNASAAVNAQFAVDSNTAVNSTQLGGLSSTDFIRNSISPIANQNFNIVGNGVINGTLNVAGAATQNRGAGGFVKALVYVNHNGVLVRCFNGVTGSTSGNCGFAVTRAFAGKYFVDFGFQVNDRFVSVSPGSASTVTLAASFSLDPAFPSQVTIRTNITDVDHFDSFTDQDFMLIVY